LKNVVEEYLREELAALENPHRQDRGRILEELVFLFRIYFAVHKPSKKE